MLVYNYLLFFGEQLDPQSLYTKMQQEIHQSKCKEDYFYRRLIGIFKKCHLLRVGSSKKKNGVECVDHPKVIRGSNTGAPVIQRSRATYIVLPKLNNFLKVLLSQGPSKQAIDNSQAKKGRLTSICNIRPIKIQFEQLDKLKYRIKILILMDSRKKGTNSIGQR